MLSQTFTKAIPRFWAKVDKRGPDECWPWKASRNRQGYGRFRLPDRHIPAARFALALKLGRPVADDCVTLHSCDNPPCCNPAHLREGTVLDNRRDCIGKGRSVWRRGADHTNAKLTDEQVVAIREEYATGEYTQRELAARYWVSQAGIGDIVRGEYYPHLGGPRTFMGRQYRRGK